MKYLVADFEFTVFLNGPGKPRAFFPEVIEAAWAIFEDAQEHSPYQTYVKPQFFPKLTTDCYNITLIEQADVDTGISYSELLEKIAQVYVPGEMKFVCWGDSDQLVLTEACNRYKLPCPIDWSDYLDLAIAYKEWTGKEKTPSLKTALEETDCKREGFDHLALHDALHTGRVLQHMIQKGWLVEK